MNKVMVGRHATKFMWVRILAAVVAAGAMVTGYIGLWQYVHTDNGSRYGQSWLDVAYYDIQLFVLGSAPLEGSPPFNIWLDIGRFAATAVTVSALVIAGKSLLDQWRSSIERGHVIVVGTTTEARAIAAKLTARRERVREVEDASALNVVGMRRARKLYACVDTRLNEEANVAIALQAPLTAVYAQFNDPTLIPEHLARRIMLGESGAIEFFNVEELAARRHVENDKFFTQLGRGGTPHIVVAGASAFGRALLVELARRWKQRTANLPETTRTKIGITLIGWEVGDAAHKVISRWPVVNDACEITTSDQELDAVLRTLLSPDPILPLRTFQPPDRWYICYDDEDRALRGALTVAAMMRRNRTEGVVLPLKQLALQPQTSGRRINRILHKMRRRPHIPNIDRPNILRIADLAADILVDGEPQPWTEHLARLIHQRYVATQTGRGVAMGTTAAMRPWDALSKDLKESNRAQAHDLPQKLHRIGAIVAPRSDRAAPFAFRDGEVELLAHEEHDRWMADRRARGWKYGKARSDRRKIHPAMLDWDDLPDSERDKDRDSVRNILDYDRALADLGLQIVRLTP